MRRSILSALDRAAELFGDSPAGADAGLSYRAMAERVRGLRGGLGALGAGPGQVVGVLMGNSVEHLELCFAVPGSGAALADLDVRRPLSDLEFVVNDSNLSVLVVDDAYLETGARLKDRCPRLSRLVHCGGRIQSGGAIPCDDLFGGSPPNSDISEETLAAICYTSGSHGTRGVMLSHGNLLHRALQVQSCLGARSDDCYLHAVPMSHPIDVALSYLATWVGARHSFVADLGAGGFREAVEAERATVAVLEPGLIAALLDDPQTYGADLASLRAVIVDSDVPAKLQRRVVDLLGCDVLYFHGMPEAGPVVVDLIPALAGTRAGRASLGVAVELRRSDGETPAGTGEPGEVFVRGPGVMLGYWNRPEETACAVGPGGWYRTGELAVADEDGAVHPLGAPVELVLTGDGHEPAGAGAPTAASSSGSTRQ